MTDTSPKSFAKTFDTGTIPPTPACKRALSLVISALKKQGHEVVDLYVVLQSLKKVSNHLIPLANLPIYGKD